MEWRTAQGTEYPALTDTVSSRTHSYVRRNVVEKTEDRDGEAYTYYEYEECALTKDAFAVYMESLERGAQMEQTITDLEIGQMEQEQEITDHDIAIMELQEKVGA